MQYNKNYLFLHKHIVKSNVRTLVLEGGTRSGKTWATLHFFINLCLENVGAGIEIAIVRKTLTSIKSTVLKDFLTMLKEYNLEFEHNKQDATIKLLGNHFAFFGCDNDDKLRGFSCDILYVNEALEIDSEEWLQLKIRTRGKIIVDYNPSEFEHYLYTELDSSPEAVLLRTTYKDNPHLPDIQVREIERLAELDPIYAQIYTKGERGQIKDLIYPSFEQIDAWPSEAKKVCYGLDFGFSNDPAALVKVGVFAGRLVVEELIYEKGLHYDDIFKLCQQHNVKGQINADSADPRGIDYLRRKGLNIQAVKKGAGSIEAGISFVRQNSPLQITRQSQNILSEVRKYKYNSKGEPIDAFNHALDALRYAVTEMSTGSVLRIRTPNMR